MMYRVTCDNKYRNLAPAIFTEAADAAQYIIERADDDEKESLFNEMLDDTETWPNVCGIEFRPSAVLRACDPIAYRIASNEFIEYDYNDELTDEIIRRGDYINHTWLGFTVESVY